MEQLRPHLQAFDLSGLMVEGLGWNHYKAKPEAIQLGEESYSMEPVAEKGGFVIYSCDSKSVPPYPVRRKIERRIARLAFEHMIVFTDRGQSLQVWQWVKREEGRFDACRELEYRKSQPGNLLLQHLQKLAFSLEEEKGLLIPDVVSRVRQAMDVEKVTKRFYERFKKEMETFRSFIEGIAVQGDREWYASLMLNRMMFVYFVQKQGFLDDDHNYLRNRLERMRAQASRDHFQQFYRLFLLRLFHEGLALPEADRAPELVYLLGKVPYLNGGLFSIHDLEQNNPRISIPDEAFEKIFDFFDDYLWNLDWRPSKQDNEINPDVLGYIFEKYVNQKQMGAYYTKEDITGYISRNTVIPFLFDAAKKEYPAAFTPRGSVWRLLRDDPDRYIYSAVGHGLAWECTQYGTRPLNYPYELPEEITAGVDDVSKRDGWNRPAPSKYALPTETWREVVARRQHYYEVKSKLKKGEIQNFNDLITLNLDVERFANDVIVQSEGPGLLRAFWHAISDVSIMDPTCGSGAFLFAALNILEPLYTACLEGMQGFLDDLKRFPQLRSSDTLEDFQTGLNRVKRHPNQQHYVLKSIIINNLYGVDIMEEAVEICKLRLFLKLMAQLKTNDQIEPLPDIDFNIRSGNTLVGFASLGAVLNAVLNAQGHDAGQRKVVLLEDEKNAMRRIKKEADAASQAFNKFRKLQTVSEGGWGATATNKADLRRRLDSLRDELDHYLATEYGIHTSDISAYKQWRVSHLPFHWFVEFYEIMQRGGFDVIIGNPPYLELDEIDYELRGYTCFDIGAVHALCIERSVNILNKWGCLSMIVPLALPSTPTHEACARYLRTRRAKRLVC